MKNASVYALLSITSLACAITACDEPGEPEELDIVVRQLCTTPDEAGELVTVERDSSSEWAEDSLTIMTPKDSPFVVRDDGLEGDAVAGDGIFTARSSTETTLSEQQCMAVDVDRPGEVTDRLRAFCVAESVEFAQYMPLCGETCWSPTCICISCWPAE